MNFIFCSIANFFCSFQNDSTPKTTTRTTTKLLLGPLSVARGQKLLRKSRIGSFSSGIKRDGGHINVFAN